MLLKISHTLLLINISVYIYTYIYIYCVYVYLIHWRYKRAQPGRQPIDNYFLPHCSKINVHRRWASQCLVVLTAKRIARNKLLRIKKNIFTYICIYVFNLFYVFFLSLSHLRPLNKLMIINKLYHFLVQSLLSFSRHVNLLLLFKKKKKKKENSQDHTAQRENGELMNK